MRVDEFDFFLPEELIAQSPLPQRQMSRLLELRRETGTIRHRHFTDLLTILQAGDTLVLNDTRVIPARLYGQKVETGASIEVLLLKQCEQDVWEALVKPARRVKTGTEILFGSGVLRATCVEEQASGQRKLKFQYDGIFQELLDRLGQMPLPPYIKEQLAEPDRYQTVYAKHRGSAAAPTAGLHFTADLLKRLEHQGVHLVYVTLHVGLGTFRPVQAETVEEHHMHAEYYQMSEEAAAELNRAKEEQRRIIAVGTTSLRTLETIATEHDGTFNACSGWTDIFIYPGYSFRAVDGLLTNFHLPKSTLLMLVSALAGKDTILKAYEEAVRERYRFFSFGDAMLIL